MSQIPLDYLQVAAQTGHEIIVVDTSEDVLNKSHAYISKSLARVAKKKHGADSNVSCQLLRIM